MNVFNLFGGFSKTIHSQSSGAKDIAQMANNAAEAPVTASGKYIRRPIANEKLSLWITKEVLRQEEEGKIDVADVSTRISSFYNDLRGEEVVRLMQESEHVVVIFR